MDANGYDTNHLDADVLLPPRKRLLAGLKKHNCSESTSQYNPTPIPSFTSTPLTEFDVRLSNLLKSYKNGSNMSPEEIAGAAGSAATAAATAAQAARVAAEEKAAIAAKAVSAAKSALDLVASISEETNSKDKHHKKKNKLKKHIPVQLLYRKYQPVENSGTHEELARRLHQDMNSSVRISEHSKHKKVKISPPNEKSGMVNGENVTNYNGKLPPYPAKVDESVSKSSNPDKVEIDNGEVEVSHSKEKTCEACDNMCINGRKRGRIKQKKLPLSICSFKDQANPKEEVNLTNSLLTRPRTDKSNAHHVSLLSIEPPADNVKPIEVRPT